MANMTGPVSNDAHAGGQIFNPKLKVNAGTLKGLSNNSEEARRTIMSMKYSNSGSSFPTNIESAMTRKPS